MRRDALTRDPATPLWLGAVVLRVPMWAFALTSVIVHRQDYQRPGLAWAVIAAMACWTVFTAVVYTKESLRWTWVVVADVLLTCGLMLLSPLILSDAQYVAVVPLITTVWASVPPAVAGTRFGLWGGALAGLLIAVCTGLARKSFTLDVLRDGVLLIATGVVIGVAATIARRASETLARALRTEAATAERERLARSIHDSVLQVLARVRRRGTELGGEAAELATLAGEQEIALRSLVSTKPETPSADGELDLRAALQILATPKVQVSAPAEQVLVPERIGTELVAVVREALSNVEEHAGQDARAWLLLEDLGSEVAVTVRDDGPGIPEGRLAAAEEQGHLGVAKSIRGRVADLGGTSTLDTGQDAGTEWEFRVPLPNGENSAKKAGR